MDLDSRPKFDMNQCEFGDKLISKHGARFMYVRRVEGFEPFNHVIVDDDGEDFTMNVTRTDDGFVWRRKPMEWDHDIVGFAQEE